MDPPPRDKLGGDPIEIAGLFEGDIAGVSSADVGKVRSNRVSSTVWQLVWCLVSFSLHNEPLKIQLCTTPTQYLS